MTNLSIAFAINQGAPQGCRPHQESRRPHHQHHCNENRQHKEAPEAPERNQFLDFLTAPLQMLGKGGGNQNDKEYDKYLAANQTGNLLKG